MINLSLRCGSIPQSVITHVLQDLVAVVVLVSAGVLVGPLDGEDRSLVVIEAANVISAAVVVLRVKEPVGVVSVPPGFIETVVRTSANMMKISLYIVMQI